MKYQIVLQYPLSDNFGFEELISLEDELILKLNKTLVKVDGHDCGSGEANIFLFTDSLDMFEQYIIPLVKLNMHFSDLKSGYRICNEEVFHPLWPKDLVQFSVL